MIIINSALKIIIINITSRKMKIFVMMADYKHGEESEILSVAIDQPMNDVNNAKFKKFLKKYIKKYFPDISYEGSSKIKTPFVLTTSEYNLMMERVKKDSYGYVLGSNIDSYLFPIGIRCLLKEDNTIKLSDI